MGQLNDEQINLQKARIFATYGQDTEILKSDKFSKAAHITRAELESIVKGIKVEKTKEEEEAEVEKRDKEKAS